MKRVLTFVAVIIFSTNIIAQEYIPFPDSLATWNYFNYFSESEGGTECLKGLIYHIEGDTLVEDQEYSKLYVSEAYDYNSGSGTFTNQTTDYTLIGGIREDSTKKVWYKNFNFDDWEDNPWFSNVGESFMCEYYLSPEQPETLEPMTNLFTDSTEVMLYDFGLEVGDSIKFVGDYTSAPYWATVEEIVMDILERRNFIFSNPPEDELGFYSRVWIEGIGDSKADLFSMHDIVSWEGFGTGASKRLTCFSENGEQVYTPETAYVTDEFSINCEDLLVGIEELGKQGLEIYPNPNEGFFTIKLPNHKRSTITIYNIIGAQVYHRKEISGDRYEVDISELPKGIYMILLESDEGNYSEKILKD